MWTSIILILLVHGLKKAKILMSVTLVIAILVASLISSFYFIVPLHEQVYSLNEPAKQSVGKFFFVGNTVSMLTHSQYAFDVFHFLWNKQVTEAGTCLGSGC